MNMALWHFRNSIVADLKKSEDLHTKRMELDEKVQDIFRIGVTGRPNNQSIIQDTDINKVLQIKISDKEDWINMVQTLQKQYIHSFETLMSNIRTRFEQWMYS